MLFEVPAAIFFVLLAAAEPFALFCVCARRALEARAVAAFGLTDAAVALLEGVRLALARAAVAPGLRDLDLAVFRALAPALDFFEPFFRDAIRGLLLPRSASAEHATGDAILGIALYTASFGSHRALAKSRAQPRA